MNDLSRRSILVTTGAAIFSAGIAAAQSANPPNSALQRRVFSNWAGPAIPIWSHRPTGLGRDAPVLIIMHGVGRDADRYLSQWKDMAERHGFIALCPEFSQEAFPGALNYNLGGVFDRNGVARPRQMWSFSAIAPIFDWFVQEEGLTTSRFDLFGHSAGAQFAHRFTAFAAPPKLRRVIAANAGWYTLPDLATPWPSGLSGAPEGANVLRTWLGADMTILLGTMDTDPNHPSLNRDPENMVQGPHRLARGVNFHTKGREAAAKLGTRFGWSIDYAPGIAHDNGGMASFAAALLFPATPLTSQG